jgi:hypothetical protein
MPIHPENVDRYPPEWKAISNRIRFVRAGARCECSGECGHDHVREHRILSAVVLGEMRCQAHHMNPHPVTGSNVVLTVAHLDHTPENVDDENLRAYCQRCHLAYDRDHHAESRRRRAAEATT